MKTNPSIQNGSFLGGSDLQNKTAQVYDLINSKAGSNQLMQGISGAFGFPFTLIADAGVIFTHYGPMLNAIRAIYGRSNISYEVVGPILNGCTSEILADIVVDKVIGQIPLLGIGANIMCAKTMTWRLGLVFAMISARGEEISAESVKNATKMIRQLFLQKSMFSFKTPSIATVDQLLGKVSDITIEDFDAKVSKLLAAL